MHANKHKIYGLNSQYSLEIYTKTINLLRLGDYKLIFTLGITLDTLRMEARPPADRIDHLKEIFAQFESRHSCTLKQLQSLIGTLNFACKVIPPGRPFLQRMIDLTGNIKMPHHHIKFNSGFFKDLEIRKRFIVNWNGANFFLSSTWQNSDCLQLHTDASGVIGYRGICGSKWFQGTWQPHQLLETPGISIAWQERFAIIVACQIWGDLLRDKRIIFKCDMKQLLA